MGYFRKNIDEAQGYTPGFQLMPDDVIKLNTNENPYPPSPEVLDALTDIKAEQLQRYPDPMGSSFREAAGQINHVSAENIMCCNGGDDLLTIAFRSFCDSTRQAAYPVPCYSLYPLLAELQNCKVAEIPFDSYFNLPAGLAETDAALTIVCNPNAPSASCVDVDDLADLAGRLSGVLLIDEAYVDFAESNCAQLIKDFDNVIILRSMSKGYSLAGIRFGYAIATSELIDGMMKVKDSYNVDALAVKAATAAIKDQQYFRQNIKKVKQSRQEVTLALRGLGFDVPDSSANFVLAKAAKSDAGEIYEKLARRNIYVRYFDLPGLKDKLRITVGTKEQNDALLAALKEILAE